MIKKMLDIISVVGMFMIVWGVLFFLQNLLLGNIPFLHDSIILGTLRLKDLLFTVTSALIISRFVTFYKPRKSA